LRNVVHHRIIGRSRLQLEGLRFRKSKLTLALGKLPPSLPPCPEKLLSLNGPFTLSSLTFTLALGLVALRLILGLASVENLLSLALLRRGLAKDFLASLLFTVDTVLNNGNSDAVLVLLDGFLAFLRHAFTFPFSLGGLLFLNSGLLSGLLPPLVPPAPFLFPVPDEGGFIQFILLLGALLSLDLDLLDLLSLHDWFFVLTTSTTTVNET